MAKTYHKPTISTIEIPERTAYACNIAAGIAGCPHTSNVTGFATCSSGNGITIQGIPLGRCA